MLFFWLILGAITALGISHQFDESIDEFKVNNAIKTLKALVVKYRSFSVIPDDDKRQMIQAFRNLSCPVIAKAIEQGVTEIKTLPQAIQDAAKLELKSLEARGIDI